MTWLTRLKPGSSVFGRKLAAFFACVAMAIPALAAELEKEPFTEERFRSLQEQGELVLIDVHADWCPTCAKQGDILAEYLDEHPEAPIHLLNVDFDSQKQWVTHFKAPRQSTLILFRGDERLWFSVAETRKEKIFAALDSALEATE